MYSLYHIPCDVVGSEDTCASFDVGIDIVVVVR